MPRKINFDNDNQMHLPFNQAQSRSISFEDRERAFWFLVSASLLSLVVYVYAINAAAHHIAVRENLEKQVAETNARLGTLEFNVIALKNNITLEVAQNYGFSEVKAPLYVSRTGTESALSFNTAQ
jgi:hypothetical protein